MYGLVFLGLKPAERVLQSYRCATWVWQNFFYSWNKLIIVNMFSLKPLIPVQEWLPSLPQDLLLHPKSYGGSSQLLSEGSVIALKSMEGTVLSYLWSIQEDLQFKTFERRMCERMPTFLSCLLFTNSIFFVVVVVFQSSFEDNFLLIFREREERRGKEREKELEK